MLSRPDRQRIENDRNGDLNVRVPARDTRTTSRWPQLLGGKDPTQGGQNLRRPETK